MLFCEYKEIFGKPNEGAHSLRVLNIAIIDVILTFIVSYVIYKLYPVYSYWKITVFMFILAIILHRLFCVNTTINKLIFGNI